MWNRPVIESLAWSMYRKTFADLSEGELDELLVIADQSQHRVSKKSYKKRRLLSELGMRPACQSCGYSKSLAALHFHHKDRSTKTGSVAAMSFRDALAETKKCVLLCANCHAELHESEAA